MSCFKKDTESKSVKGVLGCGKSWEVDPELETCGKPSPKPPWIQDISQHMQGVVRWERGAPNCPCTLIAIMGKKFCLWLVVKGKTKMISYIGKGRFLFCLICFKNRDLDMYAGQGERFTREGDLYSSLRSFIWWRYWVPTLCQALWEMLQVEQWPKSEKAPAFRDFHPHGGRQQLRDIKIYCVPSGRKCHERK